MYAKKQREKNAESIKAYQDFYRVENAEALAAYRLKNRDRLNNGKREHMRGYREKNPEIMHVWRANNKERMTETARVWHRANPEKVKASRRKWVALNPEKIASENSRRRSQVERDLPWGQEGIKDVYLEAKYFGMSVDHIVPLTHKLVCGLHVRDNIQLLTGSENSIKGNAFTPYNIPKEMP